MKNFLESPLESIIEARRANPLCSVCKADGLHRFCAVYTNDPSELETG